jgi:RimJ/RimL family protein N-acetyltransferase
MKAFDQVALGTPRLRLRPLVESDAPALLAIFSDPEVTRYWSTLPWETIDQAEAMIARDRKAMAAGEHIRLGLQRDGEDKILGVCTLFAFMAQCRRAEVGYCLAPAAWGKGYMHEALQALLDYGFRELGLNRVEADIDPRNTRSATSLERLGFTREGYLRERWIVGDEVSDTALYGLLLRDWNARAAATPG